MNATAILTNQMSRLTDGQFYELWRCAERERQRRTAAENNRIPLWVDLGDGSPAFPVEHDDSDLCPAR